MSDEPESTPRTVLTRLVAMTLSEDRALTHLKSSFVRVGGEIVTDPDLETDAPIVICPPPITEQQQAAS
ncbi:hypothetical protein [Pseudonocardia oroxyli]|uniref:Uncharacterized protein n=1 Tax=Pseudonocardia oroxyli TaxID=366584 RepID=A0A1G8CPN7_PSEOR|nr:hypothetical protein [Pseudonocardia oroxyli]SDH47362.1 hypothetical protein SAMN05216377_12323 [Pseudonocardia oroxyli]